MTPATPKKIIYIVAAGKTVKSFLQAHFVRLSESGYNITLMCSSSDQTAEVLANTNVRYIPANINTNIAPLSDILSLFKVTTVLFREKPDVVHAHMSKAGLVSMISAFIARIPHRIYHNHGMAAFSSHGVKRRLLQMVEKTTCKFATQVIFCGESTLNEAVRRGYCPQSKAIVIGNGTISGINTDRFQRIKSHTHRSTLRNKYGLQENAFTVGFVGRIVEHKGIDNIIKSWPLVNQSNFGPSQLIIAGANDQNTLFSRLSELCNSHNNVKYLGRVDNIEEIYHTLDVLILPSWHEGFPYSVMEAQSAGVPAIVTDVPGNTDAVAPGVTGLHIPVENPEALAAAIAKIANDATLRQKMSIAASDLVRKFYSENRVLDNLTLFYHQLLK